MSPSTTSHNVYLIRHGATTWSESGKHTGLTDIPLTEQGRHQSLLLSKRLEPISFSKIFCSPLQRAAETCRICRMAPILDPDLVEWNYGKYEGLTTTQIHQENPQWNLFRNGAPGGESPTDVRNRAKQFLSRLQPLTGNIAIFSSAHFLRVLATVWIEAPISFGEALFLSPASISVLGYEHTTPVIICWNDIAHLSIH